MADTDEGDDERRIVTEADATSADGKRYRTMIINKSGETSGDDS